MNRLPLSVFAACLMRSRAVDTPTRFCVRSVLCDTAFPSACRLPSTPSADLRRPPLGSSGFAWLSPAFPPSCPFRSTMIRASASFSPLFGCFAGTTRQSDSLPRASMARVF